MKISIKDTLSHKNNIIFLTDDLTKIAHFISLEELNYFKDNWQEDSFQFLKKMDGFLFVIKTEKSDKESVRKSAHKVHEYVKKSESIRIWVDNKEFAFAFLEGIMLSNYQFLKYIKDADKKKNQLQEIEISSVVSKGELKELENVMQSVFWVRDMVNEPVSYLDAEKFAKKIESLGKSSDFKVETFGKNKIQSLKMGGLLAVNKGSDAPPTFSILEYKPENAKNEKPVVLVGKGVVYDTGGLNIKTGNYMDGMKSDMAGAACMVATIDALSKNKIPVHVIGLIPATDNRPGGEAFASGDIITMYDGTTVEVLNTDAEGRMILADALAYANKYEPELVIDAATLTGAAVRALGTKTSISMGNAKDKHFKKLYDAGLETGDKVFRFPFWDEYMEEMKSDIADLKNLGGANAGMITAGKFLEHFVKYPYIHLDIAGPAFLETADFYKGKGGTGAGVRLLYEFFKNWK